MGSALRVGLTGPIGAGKSTVAEVWRERGAAIVEGDEMGKLALTDADLKRRLIERFGERIIDAKGAISRSDLAEVAFATSDNQQALTKLTFPTLYALASAKLQEAATDHDIVVFDAAMLFEWRIELEFDVTVTVTAQPEILIERAMQRLGIDRKEAQARLDLQLSPVEKEERADIVIANDGDLESLRSEAIKVWNERF